MSLQELDPNAFLGDNVELANDNFNYLEGLATTAGSARRDSGLMTPVLMEMGDDDTEWLLPDNAVGHLVVLDHGLILSADDYTVGALERKVFLNYTPATPYQLAVTWSPSRGGITTPVALTNIVPMGAQYWQLPADAGVNVLIFDHRRMLRYDEYTVDYATGQVRLAYLPDSPYEITASWARGGPGIAAPLILQPLDSVDPLNRDFILPYHRGDSVLVFDHGLMLDGTQYTLDLPRNLITLNYNPALPHDIAATWGVPMAGIYLPDEALTPVPDGTNTVFVLNHEPLADTLTLRGELAGGSIVHYIDGDDYTVVGRKIEFTTAPPVGTILHAAMMSVILNGPLSTGAVNGMRGLPYNNPDVGTPAGANALVGTAPDGRLPPSVIPSLLGYEAMAYNDPLLGTIQAYEKIPTFAPDGRLVNKNLPANPALGVDNTSVTVQNGVTLEQNTLVPTFVYYGDGTIDTISYMDGATVVKLYEFTYNANGTLATLTETAGGKSIQRTYAYDGSGNMTTVTNAIL